MSEFNIRAAYSTWPKYNALLRDAVGRLTPEQLAFQPSPDRWPLWATVGHMACQRISWLCGFAGEPGAEATPFPNALYNCPGDEDLEHALNAEALTSALDSTFAVIERCLDTWTFGTLDHEIRRSFGDEEWVQTRGWVIQRVLAHDLSHFAEVNEILRAAELPQIDPWE